MVYCKLAIPITCRYVETVFSPREYFLVKIFPPYIALMVIGLGLMKPIQVFKINVPLSFGNV